MPRGRVGRTVIDLTSDDAPLPQVTEGTIAHANNHKRKATSKAAVAAAPDSPIATPPKRRKKQKEPVEKRTDPYGKTVPFRSAPTVKISERIARAKPGSAHRMFLIDRKVVAPVGSEGGAAEEFVVLGATANVYTVVISRHPKCTCPDFAKGNLCKHILFVMLRVLRISDDNPLVWQRALLTKEADEVLSGQHSTRQADNVLADLKVVDGYRRMSVGEPSGSQLDGRRPVEGECPICFETMKEEQEELSWCAACGNNMHLQCVSQWASQKRQQGRLVTCVLCRRDWVDGSKPATEQGGAGGSGYVNLKQYSQVHQQANTSYEDLYGDRAVWLRASDGEYGRRHAANLWRQLT